jgi:hypothetical protein
MGDRISIQFKKEKEKSVVLFSHWQGMSLLDRAKSYLLDLNNWINNQGVNKISYPLTRKEPNTVMVDFIRYITKDEERITSDLYLAKDKNGGDNGDNGHHIIDLNE